jgi:uncharacterized membrane protein YheB (UPF0754 family)
LSARLGNQGAQNVLEFIQTYWSYLTIPLVSGLVGYGTNWLAVKMMMSPMEFKGIGPIGWQGVVPANAGKMARLTVDHSVKKVLQQEELIDRIEPEELVDAISHRLEPFVEDMVDEVMLQTSTYKLPVSNFLWSASPVALKTRVYEQVKKQLPDVLIQLIDDLKPTLDELVDLNEVIVEKLSNDKRMLVDVFKNAAGQEFKFLERSGLYFGLPLGVPVMFAWYFYPVWWLLPMFGLMVGYITNSLAIYLVQKPLQPTKVGPFTVQGLFIKRQKEVAAYYGKVFASDLITAEIMVGELLKVEESMDRLRELIHREVNRALESSQGHFKPLAVMTIGPSEYRKISHIISDRAFEELKNPDKRSYAYIDEALDIENTLAERVGNLPPDEFFELLHPVIAEDEWKLVAVGAVLGCGAGWWQWALLS